MCFPEFCSIILIKIKCSIISSHAPFSNNICTFYLNLFDKSENIIRISIHLINLSHRFFFHSSSNCFMGSFLQSPVFILCFFSMIFCNFFMCFCFLLYLTLYPTVPPPCVYITFPVFLMSTPSLLDLHESDIMYGASEHVYIY